MILETCHRKYFSSEVTLRLNVKPLTLTHYFQTVTLSFCAQVKADRNSKKLSVLQQASRHVNEMAANVVASTKTGQDNLEEKGEGISICVRMSHPGGNVFN